MKAVKLYGARDFRLEEVPMPPDPGPGEALIRVGTVGVCGSDLHTYTGRADRGYGHQKSAGPGARVRGRRSRQSDRTPATVCTSRLTPGQRVAVEPGKPCWHCDRCEEGDPNLCRHLGFMGLAPDDGALQEYLIVPARNCFPIPDRFSMDDGALLEPLGVALHAVDLGKIRVRQSVAVLGCGPIGLLIIRLAKLAGASPLYAFDQFDWRLEAAKHWGADAVFNIQERRSGGGAAGAERWARRESRV